VLAGSLVLLTARTAWTDPPVRVRRMGPPPRPFERAEMPGSSTEVPMTGERRVLVEVRIDGKGPYRFVLDTRAAGGGRIRPELATQLGLKVVGQAVTGDPSGKNRRTVDIVEAGSLAVGDLTVTGVKLAVGVLPPAPGRPETELDGILGVGLFADHLLTLDYPARKVRIEKGSLPSIKRSRSRKARCHPLREWGGFASP